MEIGNVRNLNGTLICSKRHWLYILCEYENGVIKLVVYECYTESKQLFSECLLFDTHKCSKNELYSNYKCKNQKGLFLRIFPTNFPSLNIHNGRQSTLYLWPNNSGRDEIFPTITGNFCFLPSTYSRSFVLFLIPCCTGSEPDAFLQMGGR